MLSFLPEFVASLNAKRMMFTLGILLFALSGQVSASPRSDWTGWQSVRVEGSTRILPSITFRYKEEKRYDGKSTYHYRFKNSGSSPVEIRWWIRYIGSKDQSRVESLSKTLKPGETKGQMGQYIIGPKGQNLSASGQIVADRSSSSWTPGKRHSTYKNVIASDQPNRWKPIAGYKFKNNTKGDFSVTWAPGRSHPSIKNVHASTSEGYWKPRPGYTWNIKGKMSAGVKWQSGQSHPTISHIKSSTSTGYWPPDPGYRWRDKGNFESGVVWTPGSRHPKYRNIYASTNEGRWYPDPGYDWTDPGRDLSVHWVPERRHQKYRNIKTSEREGYWTADPGYRFNNPGTSDLSTSWYPNQRHPIYSKIYSSPTVGYWYAMRGYKFLNPGTNDLRVISTNASYLGQVTTHSNSITVTYYDHGTVDGDRVTIYSNGSAVSRNIYLTKSSKSTTIYLRKGENRVVFKALNEGSASPNTAAFEVRDGNGNVLASNRNWSLKTGRMAEIIVLRK